HQLIINADNSYSYVDFREKEIVLERDTMNKVSLKRFGNLEESAQIRVISKPGSAVHGRHYEDLAIILDFQPHEVEKTINIKTFMPTEEDALYFELALESLGGKTNPGLFKNLKCIIKGSH
ncbi:MAG TPA: Calx-beta domain-containing protein, partial [Erysipelothrix sp.]